MNTARRPTQGKLWGGRFASGPVARARGAVPVDALRLAADALRHRRLARPRARRSGAAGLLTPDDETALHAGLDVLTRRYESGDLLPDPSDEDVHGALERLLLEEVGPELGGRLRAGRSRNDQIATLLRMLPRSTTPGLSPSCSSTWSTRWRSRGERTWAR